MLAQCTDERMSHFSPTQIPQQWRAPRNVYQPQQLVPLSTAQLMRGWATAMDTASFLGIRRVACGMKCCGEGLGVRPVSYLLLRLVLTSSFAAEHVSSKSTMSP